MQKAYIVLVLALALSSTVAVNYTATNWYKDPVKILEDTDYNFTNSLYLILGGMSTSDVNVFAFNNPVPVDSMNSNSNQWTLFTKGFDPKDLSPTANTTYNFIASQFSGIVAGYAIGFGLDNDNNGVPQIWCYQTKIADGSILPKVAMTSNTDASFTPVMIGATLTAYKNIVFVYQAAETKVNYTSIILGGSTTDKEFTLSNTWNAATDDFTCEWGEALKDSQVFAAYTEDGVYKVAVIDFTTGALSGSGIVAGYEKTFKCLPYVTDVKYYGVLCRNTTYNTLTYFISSTVTNELVPLQTVDANTHQFQYMTQRCGDLTIYSMNPSNLDATVVSYEVWDVSALRIKKKTDFLTFDQSFAKFETYKIPKGGVYGLLYENSLSNSKSNVVVGQILDKPISRRSIFNILGFGNSNHADFLALV